MSPSSKPIFCITKPINSVARGSVARMAKAAPNPTMIPVPKVKKLVDLAGCEAMGETLRHRRSFVYLF